MKKYRAIPILMFALLMLACNFPLVAPPTQTPTPVESLPTITLTPPFPPSPTSTPTPVSTPTSGVPQLTPNTSAVNCRSGPNIGYASRDIIKSGQMAVVTGKNSNNTWWYVHDPNNSSVFCWVAASVSTVSGDLNNLPDIPAPSVVVTNVTVNANVSFSMCGGPNVVQFSGKITTNGATKVKYQWEIRGDKNNTTPPQTITFNGAATKNAPSPGAYTADCGNYSIRLHVLSPNDIAAKQNFKIGP